jgi:hypothetical protein
VFSLSITELMALRNTSRSELFAHPNTLPIQSPIPLNRARSVLLSCVLVVHAGLELEIVITIFTLAFSYICLTIVHEFRIIVLAVLNPEQYCWEVLAFSMHLSIFGSV